MTNVKKQMRKLVTKAALRIVSLDGLQADPAYQRDVKGNHRQIVAEFNEEALGIPLIGQREDGSLWIVDGLQRVTALRKLGWKEVRAEVFASRGPEHEAEVFKLVNLKRTKLSAGEEFKALLAAHDPAAWRIKEAVESCGYSIVAGKSGTRTSADTERAATQLTCVSTLRLAERERGVESIKFALGVVKDCWPGDRLGVYNTMIGGLTNFYSEMDGVVDRDRLIDRLRTVTPQKVLYAAAAADISGHKEASVKEQIAKLYKKRASSRRGS